MPAGCGQRGIGARDDVQGDGGVGVGQIIWRGEPCGKCGQVGKCDGQGGLIVRKERVARLADTGGLRVH